MDRAKEGLGAGLLKVAGRFRPGLASICMMGQSIEVLCQAVRIYLLDRFHDSHVEGAPPVLQQTAIRHFVGQRVFEGVFDMWKEFDLVQEFRGPQASDRSMQLIVLDRSESL